MALDLDVLDLPPSTERLLDDLLERYPEERIRSDIETYAESAVRKRVRDLYDNQGRLAAQLDREGEADGGADPADGA